MCRFWRVHSKNPTKLRRSGSEKEPISPDTVRLLCSAAVSPSGLIPYSCRPTGTLGKYYLSFIFIYTVFQKLEYYFSKIPKGFLRTLRSRHAPSETSGFIANGWVIFTNGNTANSAWNFIKCPSVNIKSTISDYILLIVENRHVSYITRVLKNSKKINLN